MSRRGLTRRATNVCAACFGFVSMRSNTSGISASRVASAAACWSAVRGGLGGDVVSADDPGTLRWRGSRNGSCEDGGADDVEAGKIEVDEEDARELGAGAAAGGVASLNFPGGPLAQLNAWSRLIVFTFTAWWRSKSSTPMSAQNSTNAHRFANKYYATVLPLSDALCSSMCPARASACCPTMGCPLGAIT